MPYILRGATAFLSEGQQHRPLKSLAMSILDSRKFDTLRKPRSFAWSNILFRAVWALVWMMLAAWTPPLMHPWRRQLLRIFGARIGRHARIWSSARIWYPPNLEMGDYSMLGWKTVCYCMAPIKIGPYAVVSQYAHLLAGSHDIDDPNFQLVVRPIEIGARAWIAAGAWIGPGVSVGEGAILGARAVAFSDLESWTVYVGNPAREVRKRRHPDVGDPGVSVDRLG